MSKVFGEGREGGEEEGEGPGLFLPLPLHNVTTTDAKCNN